MPQEYRTIGEYFDAKVEGTPIESTLRLEGDRGFNFSKRTELGEINYFLQVPFETELPPSLTSPMQGTIDGHIWALDGTFSTKASFHSIKGTEKPEAIELFEKTRDIYQWFVDFEEYLRKGYLKDKHYVVECSSRDSSAKLYYSIEVRTYQDLTGFVDILLEDFPAPKKARKSKKKK